MSRFLLPRFEALSPYTPGEQPRGIDRLIKLNTNELPYPPAPAVREAITDQTLCDLRLYPDPTGRSLKRALSGLYGVGENQVYLANGSDDILYFAFLAYCTASKAVYCDVTYGFYRVFASLVGAESTVVPLKEDYTVDVDALCRAEGTVFLANPNAPTGICLPLSDVERIVASDRDRVVLVDEAYVDFGGESALSLLSDYDNLLVVRTFSKSRAMAGARLGYAFASEAIISDLERVRYSTNPYNINRLTLLLGEKTVENEAYYKSCTDRIVKTREKTRKELLDLGFSVTQSRTNFLFASHPKAPAAELYRALKERGILVRYFAADERCKNHLRISVGSEEQMQVFCAMLSTILKEFI
ncbi:MAG: histidinol-phosphate transaminase [Clostridia bacterium]|nr:histidinol-phosphate transaminase [Clostridia bacterium]